jgi:hypothetical protein
MKILLNDGGKSLMDMIKIERRGWRRCLAAMAGVAI